MIKYVVKKLEWCFASELKNAVMVDKGKVRLTDIPDWHELEVAEFPELRIEEQVRNKSWIFMSTLRFCIYNKVEDGNRPIAFRCTLWDDSQILAGRAHKPWGIGTYRQTNPAKLSGKQWYEYTWKISSLHPTLEIIRVS